MLRVRKLHACAPAALAGALAASTIRLRRASLAVRSAAVAELTARMPAPVDSPAEPRSAFKLARDRLHLSPKPLARPLAITPKCGAKT